MGSVDLGVACNGGWPKIAWFFLLGSRVTTVRGWDVDGVDGGGTVAVGVCLGVGTTGDNPKVAAGLGVGVVGGVIVGVVGLSCNIVGVVGGEVVVGVVCLGVTITGGRPNVAVGREVGVVGGVGVGVNVGVVGLVYSGGGS